MATPATAPQGRSRGPAALAGMPLKSTADLAAYCEAARRECRAIAEEVEAGTAQVQRSLENANTTTAPDRFSQRRAARVAVRKARKSAAHMHAAGELMIGFWHDYLRIFEPLINPPKHGQKWKFDTGRGTSPK